MDGTSVAPVDQYPYNNDEEYEKSSPIKSSLWIFVSILVVGLVGLGLYYLYGYVEEMNQELDQIATELNAPDVEDTASSSTNSSDPLVDATSGFGYTPGVTPTPAQSSTSSSNGFASDSQSTTGNYGYTPGTETSDSSYDDWVYDDSSSDYSYDYDDDYDYDSSSDVPSDATFSIDVEIASRQSDVYYFDFNFMMNSAAQSVLSNGFSFKVEHECEEWLEDPDYYFDGSYDSDDTIGTGLGFIVKLPEEAVDEDDLYENSTYVIKDAYGDVVFSGEVVVPDCR